MSSMIILNEAVASDRFDLYESTDHMEFSSRALDFSSLDNEEVLCECCDEEVVQEHSNK